MCLNAKSKNKSKTKKKLKVIKINLIIQIYTAKNIDSKKLNSEIDIWIMKDKSKHSLS
jgi:hypothetical protein